MLAQFESLILFFSGHNEYKIVFFYSGNISSSPSSGIFILHLIRYGKFCSCYGDFRYCHKVLVDRLLCQDSYLLFHEVKHLRNSFEKFYGRYPDLIRKYQRSVKDKMADSFPDWFHAVVQLVLSIFFFFNSDFVTWIVTFSQLMLVLMGVTHEVDSTSRAPGCVIGWSDFS